MASEVSSLSNQAEKILDGHTRHTVHVDGTVHASIEVAAVLAELAKAHALVKLAEAIRDAVAELPTSIKVVSDS